MKKISTLVFALILLTLPVAAQTKGNAKDQEAIKGVALKFQDAWNRHDMQALAALVAEDVDFVTVGGTWIKSRKEFEAVHAKAHATIFKDSILTTKSTEVKFVRSDVAVAHVEWSMKGDKDPDGRARPPREGIMTLILEKRKGMWLIIASQNTNLRQPSH